MAENTGHPPTAEESSAPREAMIFLAPGVSGNLAGLRPALDELRRRGLKAVGVELPKGRAERAVPVYRAALGAMPPSDAIVGGHSYGGRVASIVAAEERVAGLVLLSYPLHPPGRAERWDERTEHWPRIECPVLLLSGESDPFARIGLLREAVRRLKLAELVTYPRVGHGIGPSLGATFEDALDRIAAFAGRLSEEAGARRRRCLRPPWTTGCRGVPARPRSPRRAP